MFYYVTSFDKDVQIKTPLYELTKPPLDMRISLGWKGS